MSCAPRQFVYIVRLGFIRPREEKKKMRFFVRYKVLVLTSFHDDDDDEDEDEDDDGDGCKDGGGDDDDDG